MHEPHWGRRTAVGLAGGVVLVGIIATILLVVASGRDDAPPSPPGASRSGSVPPTPDPATVLGVPMSAVEPCSLVDLGSVSTYGRVQDPVDLGEYSSCELDMFPQNGGSLRAIVEFRARVGSDVGLPGTVEKRGDIVVMRELPQNGSCARAILLADRTPIGIDVESDQASVDPCVVAETMTKTALAKLTTTGIGRSPGRARNSLAGVDMCGLVDAASLTSAGFDPLAASPGFARWYCSWGSSVGPGLQIYADRQYEVIDDAGTRMIIAGRQVQIQPGGYSNRPGRCVAQITQRRFLASNGDQRVERLQIIFDGFASQTPDELCRTATALAASAMSKLPAA